MTTPDHRPHPFNVLVDGHFRNPDDQEQFLSELKEHLERWGDIITHSQLTSELRSESDLHVPSTPVPVPPQGTGDGQEIAAS